MHPLMAAARHVRADTAYRDLLDAVQRGEKGTELRAAAGFAAPLVTCLLAHELRRPAWLITPDLRSARLAARELETVGASVIPGETEVLVLPPLEGEPYALVAPHDNVQRERVASLEALVRPLPHDGLRVVVTPARTLLLPVPPPDRTARTALVLEAGEELPPEEVAESLVRAGYVATDVVSTWGEFARRGAVLDIFPPDAEAPIRAEYWGDEITELRTFDPTTQRSVGTVEHASLGAVKEAEPDASVAVEFAERVRARIRYDVVPGIVDQVLTSIEEHGSFPGFEVLRWAVAEGASLADHLPEAILVVDRPDLVENELRTGREQLHRAWTEEVQAFLPAPDEILRPAGDVDAELEGAHVRVPDVAWADETETRVADLGTRVVRRHAGDLHRWVQHVREHVEADGSVGVVLAAPGRLERLRDVLDGAGLGERIAWVQSSAERLDDGLPDVAPGSILLGLGVLGAGARLGSLLVHSEEDVFGDLPPPRRERARRARAFQADLRDLKSGDHVVHVDHGIGRYDGLVTMGEGEQARDFLVLLYHGEDKLYVPLDRLDLIEKYSGVGGFTVKLDKLGGVTWEKVKKSVKKAMVDMTRELLELYAARKAAKGFRFSKDGEWQGEYEAAFPYEETEDQLRAIDDTKDDMVSERPMDRLVVGDVGFGKTEVALRAAFKAVMDGKQVAVLAPTTVLAFQHHQTFTRRCKPWPVKVGLLSRFRTPKEIKATIASLEAGETDIVIGTHRLLSRDVRFKDLGLLVVDEEQRFGVRHKERLKSLRREVDVLTLTATPIPRTLSMAMGGLRDMSVIETPPVNRHAIQTHVMPFAAEVVSAACEQEIDRGGQVFFVHDRVETIYSMADHVRKLVPGARVSIAHGQMPERELETSMIDFVRGEKDILVCTTVIENGVDIPRANTMIVNRADRFGLSQLYQLRGRVGRSDRQAHAYFFVPSRRELTAEARKRLAALQEFTELGSGFRIAALDLEIRGAGNLLGGEQHGHIAAVGFDMYVRLLEDTVRELKGEEAAPAEFRAQVSVPLDLRLPESYVADENQRLSIYRRFATRRTLEEVEDELALVRDRHGPAPPALENMARHARLRVRAERARIRSVEASSKAMKLELPKDTLVHPEALMRVLQGRSGARFSPEGALSVPLGAGEDPLEEVTELLKELA